MLEFEWVQRTRETLELNLVSDVPLDADVVNALQNRLTQELGPNMTLAVNAVPVIPRTASGKHRFVIGLV